MSVLIIEQPIQKMKLARGDAGTTVWLDLATKGAGQKLTDKQILELSKLTLNLEEFFQYPVDVEWALSNRKTYILQCRPITTL